MGRIDRQPAELSKIVAPAYMRKSLFPDPRWPCAIVDTLLLRVALRGCAVSSVLLLRFTCKFTWT